MNKLKNKFYANSLSNEDCWRMIVYSDYVTRQPRKFLRFRLMGLNGNLLYDEIIPRNNLGLLSKFNYQETAPNNVRRILILGGEQTASSVCRISWPDILQELYNEEGKSVDVLNFAWPDAGPAHYLQYLSEEAIKYCPDLILVNFVESDFYRNIDGRRTTYLGEQVDLGCPCVYPLNKKDQKAVLSVAVQKDKKWNSQINSPYCIPSRPWGVFIKDEQIDQFEDLKKLQKKLVDDLIEGAWMGLDTFCDYKRKINTKFQPDFNQLTAHDVKQFDTPEEQNINEENCISYVHDSFKKILSFKKPVLFIHNFHMYEIDDPWNLSHRLFGKLDSDFIDMRSRLNKHEKESGFLKRIYMYPHMTEKWSKDGHIFYAKKVFELLREKFF